MEQQHLTPEVEQKPQNAGELPWSHLCLGWAKAQREYPPVNMAGHLNFSCHHKQMEEHASHRNISLLPLSPLGKHLLAALADGFAAGRETQAAP